MDNVDVNAMNEFDLDLRTRPVTAARSAMDSRDSSGNPDDPICG
ncbi:hypothetical protein [Amycolatopsis antarctica]|nr:hypothetical protein [Amycolatopsis antarctica]